MNDGRYTPGDDPDMRMAVLILRFMRVSGAAFAVFGLAVIAGRIHLPAFMGYGLVVLGAVEAAAIPMLLARGWKNRR